jgi:NAD(P)-dependent dehydrogenase (short-subunit alcohol dehydrogenase family)
MSNDITAEDVKRGADRLVGRVAVVVDASSGIGAETARELASCGTNVVIAARNRDGLEKVAASARELGAGEVEPFVADTTSPDDLQALVRFAVQRFGRLDYAVNNAGISGRGRHTSARPKPLSGRTALITGAPRSIGRAITEALARDGANIVAHYRSRQRGAIGCHQAGRRHHRGGVRRTAGRQQPGRLPGAAGGLTAHQGRRAHHQHLLLLHHRVPAGGIRHVRRQQGQVEYDRTNHRG